MRNQRHRFATHFRQQLHDLSLLLESLLGFEDFDELRERIGAMDAVFRMDFENAARLFVTRPSSSANNNGGKSDENTAKENPQLSSKSRPDHRYNHRPLKP